MVFQEGALTFNRNEVQVNCVSLRKQKFFCASHLCKVLSFLIVLSLVFDSPFLTQKFDFLFS